MQIVNSSPTAVYSGISNAMLTISRVEGFRTLWRGVSSVVLGAGLLRWELYFGKAGELTMGNHRAGACGLFCYV